MIQAKTKIPTSRKKSDWWIPRRCCLLAIECFQKSALLTSDGYFDQISGAKCTWKLAETCFFSFLSFLHVFERFWGENESKWGQNVFFGLALKCWLTVLFPEKSTFSEVNTQIKKPNSLLLGNTAKREWHLLFPVIDVIFPVNLILPFFLSRCYYQIPRFDDVQFFLMYWIFWWYLNMYLLIILIQCYYLVSNFTWLMY